MTDKPTTTDPSAEPPKPTYYKDPCKDAGPQNHPPAKQPPPAGEDPSKPDPTRYGDWEINGRCIDF
tara:strand:+ start:1011 stop:1208 length:198 start_codon:yes stop_codon:yes gene_type:complete